MICQIHQASLVTSLTGKPSIPSAVCGGNSVLSNIKEGLYPNISSLYQHLLGLKLYVSSLNHPFQNDHFSWLTTPFMLVKSKFFFILSTRRTQKNMVVPKGGLQLGPLQQLGTCSSTHFLAMKHDEYMAGKMML